MNRRRIALTLVATTATLPALAGCQAVDSVVDYFGPRPESRLLALADAAATDALSLSGVDDHAAGLRSSQADALYAEITRLCGTDDAGNPPRSCEVERPTEANHAADSGEIMENAASATTEAADEVTVESRTLVTEQAIALNAWLPGDAPDIPELSQPEQKSAADLLSWEYEQVYGLDFARAYVGPEHEDKVDHRLAVHHRRIDALQDAFGHGNLLLAGCLVSGRGVLSAAIGSPGLRVELQTTLVTVSGIDVPVTAGLASSYLIPGASRCGGSSRRGQASKAECCGGYGQHGLLRTH